MKTKIHQLLLSLLMACLCVPFAAAQTAIDRAALYTQIDTLFADTGVNPITPADMRNAFKSLAASSLIPLTDGTPAAGSHTHPASGISDSTAVGRNFMTLADPGSVVFVRVNADNTISVLDAATYRAAIGAGTSSFSGDAAALSGILDPARIGSGSPLQVVRLNTAGTGLEYATVSVGGGDALIANPLTQFSGIVATNAEVNFLSGVTSPIQTQMNGKEPTIVTLGIAKGGTSAGTSVLARAALNKGDTPLTDGATINTDGATGNVFTVTLGGNRTMAAPTNLAAGATYIFRFQQDGTGSRTLTWNAAFKWPGGTAPTLTTAANALDLVSATTDGTSLFCTYALDIK